MPRRRPVSHWLLMLPFVAAGLNALVEAVEGAASADGHLQLLAGLQGVLALASVAVAVAIWRRAPWTVWAIALWGLVGGGMVLALGPLVGLSTSERRGMPMAAGVVVLIAALCAVLVRRFVLREEPGRAES